MSKGRMLKYEVAILRECQIAMPREASILHVAVQDDAVRMWAFVPETAAPAVRTFRVCATGEPIAMQHVQYTGTALSPGGTFVWHVFELLQPEGGA